MNLLQAVILGLVEGITEYLPVSSTGHLIIALSLLGLDEAGGAAPLQKSALDAFIIVIQGGAILAVLGLYWPRVWQMIRGVLGGDAAGLKLAINLFIAFLPAAVLGLLMADWIGKHLFYPAPVMAALFLGGVVMIGIGRWQKRIYDLPLTIDDLGSKPVDSANRQSSIVNRQSIIDIEHLTWRRALLIGLMQCLALWPGMSRSMVTIVGGMIAGMRPRQAAEFSFLLGLPTLGGACVYSAIMHTARTEAPMWETLGWLPLIVGFIVATISAALAIKWLVAFLTRHGLVVFGWYRLALCAVLGVLVWQGVVRITPPPIPPPEQEIEPALPMMTPANEQEVRPTALAALRLARG